MRKGLLLCICIFFYGCSKAPSVHVQHYVEAKDERASIFVGSPDPESNAPLEEKFLVQWHIPQKGEYSEVLELEILYGDMTVEKVRKSVSQNQGVWIYRLPKAQIIEKSGILTYRVLLTRGKETVATWEDLLWFSLITK